jgi:hypothetical protein
VVVDTNNQARARGITTPEPPEEPLATDCCGRGCEPCVFTVYYAALTTWRKEIERRWAGK